MNATIPPTNDGTPNSGFTGEEFVRECSRALLRGCRPEDQPVFEEFNRRVEKGIPVGNFGDQVFATIIRSPERRKAWLMLRNDEHRTHKAINELTDKLGCVTKWLYHLQWKLDQQTAIEPSPAATEDAILHLVEAGKRIAKLPENSVTWITLLDEIVLHMRDICETPEELRDVQILTETFRNSGPSPEACQLMLQSLLYECVNCGLFNLTRTRGGRLDELMKNLLGGDLPRASQASPEGGK